MVIPTTQQDSLEQLQMTWQNFLSAFNNDGLYNGIKLLNLETIEIMKTIHYPNVAYDQGLIWYYKKFKWKQSIWSYGSDLGSVI